MAHIALSIFILATFNKCSKKKDRITLDYTTHGPGIITRYIDLLREKYFEGLISIFATW